MGAAESEGTAEAQNVKRRASGHPTNPEKIEFRAAGPHVMGAQPIGPSA